MTALDTPDAGPPEQARSRSSRRRDRTRRKLLDAARTLLTEQGTTDVSIQEITDLADVGFGSFYNHFEGKPDLFAQAGGELLEQLGAQLQEVTADLADPAEVFSVSFRLTSRLATTSPTLARVFVDGGMSYLLQDRGLAPQARRDIERATAAGRFTVTSPQLALSCAAGCLFSFLHLRLQEPALASEADGDELTEMLLTMYGMAPAEAHELAHRALPSPNGPHPPQAATPPPPRRPRNRPATGAGRGPAAAPRAAPRDPRR